MVSPFDLSRTLLVGGGLLVPCSFLGPPGINNSCKWLLWCLAGVASQCASPNKYMCDFGESRVHAIKHFFFGGSLLVTGSKSHHEGF